MKRYDWSHGGMDEDETGRFVRFEDVQAEIAKLRGALEAARHIPPTGLLGQARPVPLGNLRIDTKEMVAKPIGGSDWVHTLIRRELSK